MEFRLWPFAFIFYTDRFIPERFGAFVLWPCIFIRPKYRDDVGLLVHELTHVRQLFRYLILPFLLLYKCSDRFRFKMEVQAYRAQLSYAPEEDRARQRRLFSNFIVNKYGLNVRYIEAHGRLM